VLQEIFARHWWVQEKTLLYWDSVSPKLGNTPSSLSPELGLYTVRGHKLRFFAPAGFAIQQQRIANPPRAVGK
jgi:hypothetical protein